MKLVYIILLISIVACHNSGNKNNNSSGSNAYNGYVDEGGGENSNDYEYSDGTWCADVEYYNPNTGTRHTYSLDVEVEGGELVQIDWPNGGWLDESHFFAEDITSGECTFTSDRGYEYTVTLTDKGGCGFSDDYRMRNDIQEDIRLTTCPKCGDEKDAYEELCDNCQDEAETCPKCYGYKFEWERICSNCREEIEELQNEIEEDDF